VGIAKSITHVFVYSPFASISLVEQALRDLNARPFHGILFAWATHFDT